MSRRSKLVDVSDLPRHFVLYALWKTAVPDAAPPVRGPASFETPSDAKQFLDLHAKTFVACAAGRAIYCELGRPKINPKEYDAQNGKGAAVWAIGELQRYLSEFQRIFDTSGKARANFERHRALGFAFPGERIFPKGRALMDELFQELRAAGMPPYFRPEKRGTV
jgi:hypothetical protein